MTGHIPETFIEELLNRVDIVELIQSRIELKRAGGNFVARCPFHAEKTPSFSVSASKQFYHCFGCGAHGNAIKFLTENDGMHFVDAVESLAARVGLVVPKDEGDKSSKTKKYTDIYSILEDAAQFFKTQLIRHPTQDKAIQYLKRRGITKQSVIDFEIGYAPVGWDTLVKALGGSQTRIDHLLGAGLIISKENGPYFDRFRERIMFPIRNKRGNVVGFGGRTLGDGTPKYLNSPETPVFNKSQELYGLFEAKAHLKHLSELIVVEGYLDVVTLAQFGVKNVVATLGTSLSEKHLELLFRETHDVVFCFDGDSAGRAAAQRVLHLCLAFMKEGRRARFALLPEKEDPDSFVRKQGQEAFLTEIQKSHGLSDFLFESFSTNLDLHHVEGRAEFIRLTRPLIEKLPAGVFQHMMYEKLAEITGLALDKIQKNSNQKFNSNPKNPGRMPGERRIPTTPAYRAAALLLAHREFLRYIETPHGLEMIDGPGILLLCAIIGALQKEPQISTQRLLEGLKTSGDCQNEISYITNFGTIVGSVPENGREAEFLGAMERLKERVHEQALDVMLSKAKKAPLSLDEKIHLKELLEQKDRGRVD
jgi:DNA primase